MEIEWRKCACCNRLIGAEKAEGKARRSKQQNDKMWAMLTEVSKQVQHGGAHYSPDEWKVLFMHACHHDIKLLPGLDGSMVPYGGRSSHMTAMDMAELIEFIQWWGTSKGVKFKPDEGLTWTR